MNHRDRTWRPWPRRKFRKKFQRWSSAARKAVCVFVSLEYSTVDLFKIVDVHATSRGLGCIVCEYMDFIKRLAP